MHLHSSLLLVLTLHLLTGYTQPNRPVPRGVAAYTFQKTDTNNYGYYLTVPAHITKNNPATLGGKAPVPLVLNNDGYIVWFLNAPGFNFVTDFKYHPAVNKFSFCNFYNKDRIVHYVLDSTFSIVDSFTNTPGITPDSHEFLLLPNGHAVMGGKRDSTVNLSAHKFNGKPGSNKTTATGYVIEEFDANHHPVFKWNSLQHIPPWIAHPQYGYNAQGFDYCHGNAIYPTADGNYLLSFRNLNAVYKVNRANGEVMWVLGGMQTTFALNGAPWFSGQHDVRELPNGNISLFDNGNTMPGHKKSRAIEYNLNHSTQAAIPVWQYSPSPAVYSSGMGSHQTTTNRLHLINYGITYRPQPSFSLVNDSGQVLVNVLFADSFQSYRSFIYPNLPSMPNLKVECNYTQGQLWLSAPSGYTKYAWNTGETTRQIRIGQPGTYQCWVNYGAGMAGTAPVQVHHTQQHCK